MRLANKKNILIYTFSFFISTFIIVYLLNIPTHVFNESSLVNEYYYTNILHSIPIDYILIFIYLSICFYFIDKFKIYNLFNKIITVLITTFTISTIFYIIFINLPKSDKFYSRLFYKIGIKSCIYDCIILLFTYLVFIYFQKILTKLN